MRLVLDTNVLLAGMFTRGVCEALLDACWGAAEHQLFTSAPILGEFSEHATGKFHVPPNKLSTTLSVLRQHMTLVVPVRVHKSACRDVDDLLVLGTLVAAGADSLVTGDKDLLSLKRFADRPILTPRQCLEQMRR